MKTRSILLGTVASVLGFLSVAFWARMGRADEPQAPSAQLNNVAIIDMTRLYDQSSAPQAFEQNYMQVMQEAEKKMKALEGVEQLQGVEIQEYVTLVGKFAPTEAEQKRMQTLKELSQTRATELQTLQTKEPSALTPEDKKRLQALFNTSRNYRDRELPNLLEQLRTISSLKTQSFKAEQITQLRKAVGKYAKEKGIQHVFDNTVLIYSPNDITERVLEKLKKP